MNQSFDEQPFPPPSQPQRIAVQLPASAPRVTYTILGVTIFFYLLQMASDLFLRPSPYGINYVEFLGAKINSAIRAGELWRLLTPALLHGSIMHIGFNMYALLSFGTGLERRFGHGRFLALYVLSAFSGNVLSFLFTSGISLGASTAIFGLIAAEGIFLFQNRKLFGNETQRAIGNIIFVVAINLFLGLSPGIDNWGHIGGLLGGAIFAWFAGPLWAVEGIYPALHLVDHREFRDVMVGASMVVIIFGALTIWGMMYPLVK